MNNATAGAGTGGADPTGVESPGRTVPVIEESIHVGKVAVDTGGYRVVKRIETREQRVDELLDRFRVDIERRPIGRQLPDMTVPGARYEGDALVVPVIEEILVTQKRLVLVEEVWITRVKSTHRDPQTVTLRKEQIDIERLDAETSSDEPSSSPRPQG